MTTETHHRTTDHERRATGNAPPRAHRHGVEDLCEEGRRLYSRALPEGRVPRRDARRAAPCPIGHGLLRPDREDDRRLRPVAPSVALPRLLRTVEDGISVQRRREARLADLFEPFMALDACIVPGNDPLAISVLGGLEQINAAISEATARATREALAVQAHYEQLRGDFEVRTLDELTERLIVLDRTVASVPANADRTLALEVRHPALVGYLVTAFERLWRPAAPMFPEPAGLPARGGVTPRQHAVAALLVEGHTDAVIAERLSMNVRTVRVHIAKLAATLGSESRAQLGYLIGKSGILDRER